MASVYFNTTTDNLYATANLPADTTTYTVMGWAKFAQLDAADRQLFSFQNASNQLVHLVSRPSGGLLYATCDNFTGYTTGQGLTLTTWFCWALVVSAAGAGGARFRVRPDGAGSWTNAGTCTVTDFTASRTRIVIGDYGGQTALAYHRYVRMWDAELDETALSLEFASNVPVRAANLLRDMRLAGSAAATTDSANGYTMTLTGTLGADGDDPTSPVSPASGTATMGRCIYILP